MANQLITQHELERRLLRWTGSSFVPRYPFLESPTTMSAQSQSASVVVDNNNHNSWSVQELNRWFDDIELAANDCDISVEQYPEVAIYFLRGDLHEVMCERRGVYLRQTRRLFWDWVDFKEDLKRIVEEAKKMIYSPEGSRFQTDVMETLRRAHPYIASSVKLGLIIGGTAVLLPALGMMAWNRLQTGQNHGQTQTQTQRPYSPQY